MARVGGERSPADDHYRQRRRRHARQLSPHRAEDQRAARRAEEGAGDAPAGLAGPEAGARSRDEGSLPPDRRTAGGPDPLQELRRLTADAHARLAGARSP